MHLWQERGTFSPNYYVFCQCFHTHWVMKSQNFINRSAIHHFKSNDFTTLHYNFLICPNCRTKLHGIHETSCVLITFPSIIEFQNQTIYVYISKKRQNMMLTLHFYKQRLGSISHWGPYARAFDIWDCSKLAHYHRGTYLYRITMAFSFIFIFFLVDFLIFKKKNPGFIFLWFIPFYTKILIVSIFPSCHFPQTV